MKKYTLKFLDVSLEQQYQNECNLNVRYPLFKWLYFLVLVGISISFSYNLIEQQYTKVAVNSAFFIFIIGSMIIVHRYKYLSQLFLTLIILISLTIALQVNLVNNQSSLLNISNIIICAVSIAYILDFTIANILIIQTLAVELILINIFGEVLKIQEYLYCCSMIAYFMYCRYKVEFSNRTQFLLNLKDKEWTELLTKIIKKPYILFHFDEKEFTFVLRTASQQNFLCSTNEELRQFLRTARIQGNSLEQFIFQAKGQLMEGGQSSTIEIKLNYEKLVYKIELSNSYVLNHSFLIVFDEETEKLKSLNQKCTDKNHKLRDQVQYYQQIIFKILKQSLFLQNRKTILFLKKFLQFHFKQCLLQEIKKNNFKLQNINLIILAQDIQILFTMQISLDYSKCQYIHINSILPLVQLLFLDLFKKLKNDKINIEISSESDYLVIQAIDQSSIYFEKIEQVISQQMSLVIKGFTILVANQKIVGQQICLYREAMLSF